MEIAFKVHPEISASERKILFEWGPDIFHGSLYSLQWRPTDVHVVGYAGDEPVTHVGIVSHPVAVGSTRALVGGIGSVVTVPQKQKLGLAKECLRRAQSYMRSDLGVEYGFLFCPERLVEFYGRSGWRKLVEPVLVNQPGGKVTAPLCSMILEFAERWPEGPVDLGSQRLDRGPWRESMAYIERDRARRHRDAHTAELKGRGR